MSYGFGLMIESLVAVLLMLTIGYCMVLNARLKRLKADEASLKATIAELATATEFAERAVAGLKTTAQVCDATLGERLRDAEYLGNDLQRQIRVGENMLDRLSRLLGVGPPVERVPPSAPDPRAVAAAAGAFAERARERSTARAA
jgi:hypothetical protein